MSTPRSVPGFAIVTGASSGIGLELAKLAAKDGHDLLVAADTPLVDAAAALGGLGTEVRSVEADLATFEGVDALWKAKGARPLDVLIANAGHGLGHAFLDQDPVEWRHVLDTNVTGTLYLIQKAAREMVARGEGRILITGSVAGHMPGAFHAVYHGSKAFIDSFADALGNELKETGVTVTCLKPGPTDTQFFERADMTDTRAAEMAADVDPADVAKLGYQAMLDGERSVVHGLMNKAQVAGAKIIGGGLAAEMNRRVNAPDTGDEETAEEARG